MHGYVFAFDLDGTVTTQELLPLIARELDLEEELRLLTRLTLDGTLSFEASFRLRFAILRSIPVTTVQQITADVTLHPAIEDFIVTTRDRCAIVTGNLDVWVQPLLERLGCRAYTSTATIRNGHLVLDSVLDKGAAVRALATSGSKVISIGESVNDIPMFAASDIGIAYGGVHEPAPQLVQMADSVVRDGEGLCALLRSFALSGAP